MFKRFLLYEILTKLNFRNEIEPNINQLIKLGSSYHLQRCCDFLNLI